MVRPTYDFDGDTVIITGATSGIGRKIALRFAKTGATVINADIEKEPKEADLPTHKAIERDGGVAEFIKTDVSDYQHLKSVVEAAREYGGVDIMINNAGLQIIESFLDADPDQLEALLSVNVFGAFFGTQIAAQDMLYRKKPGVIINTASISSNLAQYDQVQYDASKGAIRMITRGTALELAEHGIRVNAVSPGQIATEFVDGWSQDAREAVQENNMIKPVPLDRAGTPEDIAGAYLFLASEDASYITGEEINVDGGWQIF